jgi:YHS domain-containing protein
MQVVDPVCKMTVDTERATAKGVYSGRWVYFCSGTCKKNYEKTLAQRPA